jgi:hypothetical protein
VTYSDGGQQPMIAQFAIGSTGLITPAATPSVNIPYQPDHLEVVEPNGGGPFLYVLGHDQSFTEHLSQFTAASGSLVAQSPAEVTVCNPSFTMTPDPTDGLLFVSCTQDGTIAAYAVGANGNLTETSWSPASVPLAPAQISLFTTHRRKAGAGSPAQAAGLRSVEASFATCIASFATADRSFATRIASFATVDRSFATCVASFAIVDRSLAKRIASLATVDLSFGMVKPSFVTTDRSFGSADYFGVSFIAVPAS